MYGFSAGRTYFFLQLLALYNSSWATYAAVGEWVWNPNVLAFLITCWTFFGSSSFLFLLLLVLIVSDKRYSGGRKGKKSSPPFRAQKCINIWILFFSVAPYTNECTAIVLINRLNNKWITHSLKSKQSSEMRLLNVFKICSSNSCPSKL